MRRVREDEGVRGGESVRVCVECEREKECMQVCVFGLIVFTSSHSVLVKLPSQQAEACLGSQ